MSYDRNRQELEMLAGYDRLRLASQALPPPPPGGEKPPPDRLTEWGMLARGNTLGKRGTIAFFPSAFVAGAQVQGRTNLLAIQSDDLNAHPVQLTLATPRISTITATPAILFNIDNFSGTQDNIEIAGNVNAEFEMAFAQVEWGVGGVAHRAEVDILNGLAINLTCSWLRVAALVECVGLDTRGFESATRIYELAANVGPGMPKPNNAQRTIVCGQSVPDNGVAVGPFPIPRFAKTITVVGHAGAGVVLSTFITLWRDAPALNHPVATYFTSSLNYQTFAIPNGAQYFRVQNTSGAVAFKLYAIFELSI